MVDIKIINANISLTQIFYVLFILFQSNKFVKGSFMKRSGGKIATTLMYINKKSLVNNDEINNRRYEENSEIKSMTTITSKAGSNPFAYLLRKDKKQEIKNTIVDDSMVYLILIL